MNKELAFTFVEAAVLAMAHDKSEDFRKELSHELFDHLESTLEVDWAVA